jgi:hypothetical protein
MEFYSLRKSNGFTEPDMVTKEMAKHVIDALPDEATLDDIIHALYVRLKFDHGRAEIQEGKGIPHQDAKARLKKWQR